MYVHIGEEILIKTSEIIVILEKQCVDLEKIQKDHVIDEATIHLDDNNIKSIIITRNKVYLSSIASITLKKRCRTSSFQEFNNDFLVT